MFGALTPRPPSGLRWCFDVTTLRSAPDLGGILDRPWRAGSTGARNTDALINDPAAGSCLVRISGVDSAPARAEGLARRADGRYRPQGAPALRASSRRRSTSPGSRARSTSARSPGERARQAQQCSSSSAQQGCDPALIWSTLTPRSRRSATSLRVIRPAAGRTELDHRSR